MSAHAVPLIHRSPPPCLGQVALHGQQTCPAHSRGRSGAPPHLDVQVAAPAAVAHPVLDVLIVLVICRLVPKVRPPALPPVARPLLRSLARLSSAPFFESLGPPPCSWPAARCCSCLTASFRLCLCAEPLPAAGVGRCLRAAAGRPRCRSLSPRRFSPCSSSSVAAAAASVSDVSRSWSLSSRRSSRASARSLSLCRFLNRSILKEKLSNPRGEPFIRKNS